MANDAAKVDSRLGDVSNPVSDDMNVDLGAGDARAEHCHTERVLPRHSSPNVDVISFDAQRPGDSFRIARIGWAGNSAANDGDREAEMRRRQWHHAVDLRLADLQTTHRVHGDRTRCGMVEA